MVAHGRVELLAHPLSQKYLQMKWNSYGKYFHLVNVLFYCIFLIFVTVYSYLLMEHVNPINKRERSRVGDVYYNYTATNRTQTNWDIDAGK